MKWVLGFAVVAWLVLGGAFMFREVSYRQLKTDFNEMAQEAKDLQHETDRLNSEAEQLSKELEHLVTTPDKTEE